jgi:hypothetical protein
MKRIPAILGVFALLSACVGVSASEAPATFRVSDLSFSRPSSWEWVASRSPMRQAQLAVPNEKGEKGEVVFFHFGPNNGGGTQANVERWFGQFEGSRDAIKAKTEEAKSAGGKVTYVSAEGTYLSGMPGGPKTPKPGFALLGAIIEAPKGHIFIRFTGPKAVVETAREDFKKMVEGAKP